MRVFLAASALMACFSTLAFAASDITGTVRNETRGEPAVGDEVLLVRMDGGMPVEARAKTDAHGGFTLAVQYPAMSHVVRVLHQGVGYDVQARAGDSLHIQVFDAAPQVRGITGTVEILRAGTAGKLLHVSDMVEIQNISRPPGTQAGQRTFEVYLPANAKLDSVFAAGPAMIAGTISVTSVPGKSGHFSVNFPLRPGATKFAFNYDLAYDGRAKFYPKLAFPMQQLAIMIPTTMKFSSPTRVFAILPTGNTRYQAWAANQLKPGSGPEFEVSGSGALPPLGDPEKSQSRSLSPPGRPPGMAALARSTPPVVPLVDSSSTLAPPSSQSFVLGALTFMLLAACALLFWRGRTERPFTTAQTDEPHSRQRQRWPA